jgi:hypothetical protein
VFKIGDTKFIYFTTGTKDKKKKNRKKGENRGTAQNSQVP